MKRPLKNILIPKLIKISSNVNFNRTVLHRSAIVVVKEKQQCCCIFFKVHIAIAKYLSLFLYTWFDFSLISHSIYFINLYDIQSFIHIIRKRLKLIIKNGTLQFLSLFLFLTFRVWRWQWPLSILQKDGLCFISSVVAYILNIQSSFSHFHIALWFSTKRDIVCGMKKKSIRKIA